MFHVHKKGKDIPDCLEQDILYSHTRLSCQSLKYLADNLHNFSNNVTILIEGHLSLRDLIVFKDSRNISIQGISSFQSKLDCNCKANASAGIVFLNLHGILLTNVIVRRCCGQLEHWNASVQVHNCSDIMFRRIKIMQSSQWSSALIMVDNFGAIVIHKSVFVSNTYSNKRSVQTKSYARGIHMQISHKVKGINVSVVDSKFQQNKSPKFTIYGEISRQDINWNGHSLGGGMGIVLINTSTSVVKIIINNSIFTKNKASWGAGLCIYLKDSVQDITLSVKNSYFIGNEATNGGGGILVYLGNLNYSNSSTFLQFWNIVFDGNEAREFGGGTALTALYSNYASEPGQVIRFINCTWFNNIATYGPAVEISPSIFEDSYQGFLPIPLFSNNKFENNGILKGRSKATHVTQGVFAITQFTVHFQGYHVFEQNWYSALCLTSGNVIFESNSEVHFLNNRAIMGGAILLLGFSVIVTNSNSQFYFINNSATQVGGALSYISSDQKEYIGGRKCFLKYGGNEINLDERNVTFTFVDNHAQLGGESIYAGSFYSCYYAHFLVDSSPVENFFNFLWFFYFDNTSTALATAASSAAFEQRFPVEVLPGGRTMFPLAMYDEFKHPIYSKFGLRVEDNKAIHLDNYFTTNNSSTIFGSPNQNATIILSTPEMIFNIEYPIQINLLPCPPGYYFEPHNNACRCSADSDRNRYQAIDKCSSSELRAFIRHGYWAGYYPPDTQDAERLYTSPYRFRLTNYYNLSKMPNESENLASFFCGGNRQGLVCGQCREGYSAYFHSRDVICGENKHCGIGMLFYLLSEIVPITVFFIIVITFGISFSSGALNGLVYFSQVVDIFTQDLSFSLRNENSWIQSSHQLFYGILNFEFFSIFPFCLWEGATVMDVLAFKYVTTTFSFMLILSIVLAMNYCNKKCIQTCQGKWWVRKDSSIIHGISTFLLISYGQCTRACFLILTYTYLRGKPGVEDIKITYYGGLLYFSRGHVTYAIPAIIFTIVLVVLPPLCLIVYPLVLHLLALCKLSEHPVVNKTLQFLRINHLMPLFDSFQSCYKDKLRFFAGLYFLYRIAAFLAYWLSENTPPVLVAIMILGIHSMANPYKSWRHNLTDTLIFLDIAIISSITIMIRFQLTDESTGSIVNLLYAQLFFIYLPALSFVVIIAIKLGQKLCSKITISTSSRSDTGSTGEQIIRSTNSQSDTATCISSVKLNMPLLIEYTSQDEYTSSL